MRSGKRVARDGYEGVQARVSQSHVSFAVKASGSRQESEAARLYKCQVSRQRWDRSAVQEKKIVVPSSRFTWIRRVRV